MPLPLPAKLRRVLETRSVERLGANTAIPVRCRVVAATKIDLKAASDAGQFRADRCYRLNVVTLNLPPLRERADDIPLLFSHFCARAAERFVLGLDDGAPDDSHSLPQRVEQFEAQAIREALRAQHGDVATAAAARGIARKTLYDKLARFHISPGSFR